jgi:TRAP-type C4-dicarboxylate transport system substrate-binding protein
MLGARPLRRLKVRREETTKMPSLHRALFAAVFGLLALAGPRAYAQELVYGSWVPAGDYLNSTALPTAFKQIEAETKGAIKWKLIPGGQIADGKTTFTAVKDGLMQAGLGIPTYVPNLLPSNSMLYSTVIPGDDVVAATGAGSEALLLHCPSCLEEYKKLNAIPLSPYSGAASVFMCTTPIKTVAEFKGKRVRAVGAAVELVNLAGGTPVSATLTEAVSLLQRGGIDCVYGVPEWLKTFGFGDFAKHVTDYPLGVLSPVIAFMMSRDAFHKLTPEQKVVHLRAAARITAVHSIGNFIVRNEESYRDAVANKGVQKVSVGKDFDELMAKYKAGERERNTKVARGFGVANPEAILDAYAKATEKWQKMSKDIGRDPDKFTEALWREVYSKLDPARL